MVLSDGYLADHASRLENVMARTLGMEVGQYRVIPGSFTDFDRARLPLRLRMLTPVNLSHPRRARVWSAW